MSAAPRTSTRNTPSPVHLPSTHPFMQLMGRLYTKVPATHAPMLPPGAKGKYTTVDSPLTAGHAARHWHGTATYAAPLIGADGMSTVGGADIDAGGLNAVRKVLDEATRRGVPAVAFLQDGKEHSGGHVLSLIARPMNPGTVKAKMRTIFDAAGVKAELYPSGANLRLPFGYHTRNRTRGRMLLQDGTLYNLDDQAQRDTALRAWLALPLATLDGVPQTAEPTKQVDAPTVDADRLAECWAHTDELITPAGIPACFTNPNVPGWRVLTGKLAPQKNGKADTSVMRYIGIKSLILHGRTVEECIVIGMECYAFTDTRRDGKQDADISTDIVDRCYPKARQELLDEGRTVIAHPYQFLPSVNTPAPYVVPVRKRGRKPAGNAERLLNFYLEHKTRGPLGEHAMVPLSRRAAATEFGVCVRTVDKLEHDLKARGLIDRETADDRQYSFIVLLGRGATIHENVPAEGVQQFTPATGAIVDCNAIKRNVAGTEEHTLPAYRPDEPSAGMDAALVDAQPLGTGTCVPQIPCAAAPALDDRTAVRQALQAFSTAIKGKRTKTTLADWVSSYLAAECIEIAPTCLAALIAQERTYCTMDLAQLAKRDRYYQKRGFKHEQRKIAYEYAMRGIDPATLVKRKKVRKDAPTLQPLPMLEALATDPPPPPNLGTFVPICAKAQPAVLPLLDPPPPPPLALSIEQELAKEAKAKEQERKSTYEIIHKSDLPRFDAAKDAAKALGTNMQYVKDVKKPAATNPVMHESCAMPAVLASAPPRPANAVQSTAQPPRVPTVQHDPVLAACQRWASVRQAVQPDAILEAQALSFARGYQWESARARIAEMQNRSWAREVAAIVDEALQQAGLPPAQRSGQAGHSERCSTNRWA